MKGVSASYALQEKLNPDRDLPVVSLVSQGNTKEAMDKRSVLTVSKANIQLYRKLLNVTNVRLENFQKEGPAPFVVYLVSLVFLIQARRKALVFNVLWVAPRRLQTAQKTLWMVVVEGVAVLEGMMMELKVVLEGEE